MLDLESEVHQRPGFYSHLGYDFVTGFFLSHVVKASDANIGIIANFVQFVKNPSFLFHRVMHNTNIIGKLKMIFCKYYLYLSSVFYYLLLAQTANPVGTRRVRVGLGGGATISFEAAEPSELDTRVICEKTPRKLH